MATDLEDRLFGEFRAGEEVELERALLVLSGLQTEKEVAEYKKKLNGMQEGFRYYVERMPWTERIFIPNGKLLFDYLWEGRPKRYNGNFLLTEVIDAQLSEDKTQKVGDCLGLTSLYTVLGLRECFDLTVLVSLSHILNRLRDGIITYNVENTNASGFDYELNDFFEESDVFYILAEVLTNRGVVKKELGDLKRKSGDLSGAIEDYEDSLEDQNKAIEINPNYAQAYNNRGVAKRGVGDLGGAIEDYDKAIKKDPNFAIAYHNRGNARRKSSDFVGAAKDYQTAMRLNPDYEEKLTRRIEKMKRQLGC